MRPAVPATLTDHAQFNSVTQSCPTVYSIMDCSTPGLPVHHQLPEFTQTHLHWVSDAIQPSHPLLSPSPPTFNLSQHLGLFQWVSSPIGGQRFGVSASASILPMNIQDWFPLGLTGWISLQSRDSQESSPTLKVKEKWKIYPSECRVPKNKKER